MHVACNLGLIFAEKHLMYYLLLMFACISLVCYFSPPFSSKIWSNLCCVLLYYLAITHSTYVCIRGCLPLLLCAVAMVTDVYGELGSGVNSDHIFTHILGKEPLTGFSGLTYSFFRNRGRFRWLVPEMMLMLEFSYLFE